MRAQAGALGASIGKTGAVIGSKVGNSTIGKTGKVIGHKVRASADRSVELVQINGQQIDKAFVLSEKTDKELFDEKLDLKKKLIAIKGDNCIDNMICFRNEREILDIMNKRRLNHTF